MVNFETELIVKALIEAEVPQFKNVLGVSGKELSFYLDHRNLRSFPIQKSLIVNALIKKIETLDFDLLADVPNSAALIVSSMVDRTLYPQISPVLQPKTHGLQAEILGVYQPNDRALVIDDAATTGKSLIEGIVKLRKNYIRVNDALVITEREEGAREALFSLSPKVTLHRLVTLREILEIGSVIAPEEEQKKYRTEFIKLSAT